MNFSNDILLVLLLSILSTPTDDNGEIDFANNTNFLLLLLLVLNNSRDISNVNSCNTCNTCNTCSSCGRTNTFLNL